MKKDDVKNWTLSVFKNLGVSFEKIDEVENDGVTIFSVVSNDGRILIGQNGETLQAVNHLLRRVVDRGIEDKETRYLIDINGYRKQSEEKVKGIASMLGERALTFKSEVAMEPTGSFERRIVHSLFQDHPHLITESRGFGRDRHVVIKYVEDKSDSPLIAN